MLVMVAEDDGLHRSFARATIEHLWPGDVEVIEASSGDVAIDLAQKRKPPYVVLDLQLPKATGIEVARSIWGIRADTNILFWSNFADEFLRARRGAHRPARYGLRLCPEVGVGGGDAPGTARCVCRGTLHH